MNLIYFHLNYDIYLSLVNNEFIVLDLNKDQYFFVPKKLSNCLKLILKNKFISKDGHYFAIAKYSQRRLPHHFKESAEYLESLQIISPKEHPPLFQLKFTNKLTGSDHLDWRMEIGELDKKNSKLLLLEAYLTLLFVYGVLKLKGFKGLITSIKKRKSGAPNNVPEQFFILLASALNKACFFFPIRTKCLEWAATLTLMGLRRNWKCCLQIGIQNLPFMAHAWVKANDNIVADDPKLPDNLSIILSEPYLA